MTDNLSQNHAGVFAIVGLPNAGKSSLINRLLDFKIAPVHKKPQMTKKNILGVVTLDSHQMVFIDTPGMSLRSDKIIKRMQNEWHEALESSDAVLFLLALDQSLKADYLEKISEISKKKKVLCLVNKIDLKPKFWKWDLKEFLEKTNFECLQLSVTQNIGIDELLKKLKEICPEHPFYFPEDHVTTASYREITANIILEKIMEVLQEELPYQCGVVIESFEETPSDVRIRAILIANRESQKGMIIGKRGQTLKKIGQQSRLEIKKLLEKTVYLETYVKVDSGWIKNDQKIKDYL